MSNTIRIRTTPNGGDKYLKVKLEQDFDFIEILSLKISQEDAYRKFCSDYGVIAGRVIINSGFGVPNAKVSVFIPIDDVDKNDPLIRGIYPFEVVTDKDSSGIRYNLLPDEGDPTNPCFTPIGTFPTKREVLDNDTLLNVYCKYYKFTTTTNHAGDFMIFGVPLGSYVVHVDADISDIGIASQKPFDLISQGTPAKLFESPTKFKGDTNLDKLIQVKTMNSGVNVQPFWGDPENCEIGITRLDFDLNYSIKPAAIFMGSIYGDQDKHSINKHCRPRKKLGEVCEQVTGPGSINMIRKTLDGQIEDFDIEGGRLIDDDGTWAYQIPMNLDYMVTDEQGNLILSQDPNIGVPTRARVRFNIGMDETGGEGRLRTRARYLVPNNPTNTGEIDYTFGQDTLDTSFRDMYWNKIYSVSNFISRFQRDNVFDKITQVKSRGMTGMKNVDACAGDKTPFPYNKVNTNLNPIFVIICLIIKIVAIIVGVINALVIPFINLMVDIINGFFSLVCGIVNSIISAINSIPGINIATISCPHLDYVGCITIKCPSDDPSVFAPGCKGGSNGYNADNPKPDYYDGDPAGHSGFFSTVGLDDCIAFEMAKSLDLFQFDFYNDWVNGTLFGFLLKYKKKRKGREIFCEYDCTDFGGGVDGNNNGVGDNKCYNNILMDTCYDGVSGPESVPDVRIIPPAILDNQQNENRKYPHRNGLIKKVGNEFFYAATTHDTNYKLFATELINLGSVYDCDWQGIPKIHDLLIPTTYKLPPDIEERTDDNTQTEVCGMVDVGGNTGHEFFQIDCFGVHVDYKSCLNIRHICEMGVNIDEAQEDPNTGNILVQSDCIIGTNDIDDDRGKYFRDVFFGLNSSATPWVGINAISIPAGGYSTNFNLANLGTYNFASAGANGQDYANFRGYNDDNSFKQPKHSYFFYFGLLPGKTAVEKLNQRFFTPCNAVTKDNLILATSSTPATNNPTGTLTFTFIGGTGPYTYNVTGPSGPFNGSSNPTTTLTGLAAGTYIITGVDSLGTPVTATVIVTGPVPLYCSVSVTKNATTAYSNDGQITIANAGGGTPPYTYQVLTYNNANVFGPAPLTIPQVINNLPVSYPNGYKVIITDSVNTTCVTTGLVITGPTPVTVTSTNTNIVCYGNFTGAINLNVVGGQPPYSVTTTGPAGFVSNSNNMSGLQAGVYVTTVVDSLNTTAMLTNTLVNLNPNLVVAAASAAQLAKQCNPTSYLIPFYITSGAAAGPVSIQYSIDAASNWSPSISLVYTNPATLMFLSVPAPINNYIRIRYVNAAGCISNIIQYSASGMALPPSLLTLNTTGLNNVQQCTPFTATFKFNISYLSRAPYTVNYSINGGPAITTTTSVNPTVITHSVPNGYPSTNTITVVVTDNVGCSSPALTIPMTVPSAPLTCHITTTQVLGTFHHNVFGSGGIPPYTGTGVIINNQPTITTHITDSVGCVSPNATG